MGEEGCKTGREDKIMGRGMIGKEQECQAEGRDEKVKEDAGLEGGMKGWE